MFAGADSQRNTSLRLAHVRTDQNFELGAPPLIRVFKEEAEMEVWIYSYDADQYHLFNIYPICAYSGVLGPKMAEGDLQSPEGFYNISMDQMNPKSQFHLSMNLGFPNVLERAYGWTGSALMIHGGCRSTGCYAVGNSAIEDIYVLVEAALIEHGQAISVHAFPFRMSAKNMARHANSRWISFWKNLQEGYDMFEASHMPLEINVSTRHGVPKYVFQKARMKNSSLF